MRDGHGMHEWGSSDTLDKTEKICLSGTIV